MKQRGRQSTAATAIADLATVNVHAEERPDAPYELNDDEAAEWRGVVEAMPRDWFQRETHGLLVQYCRHVVRARKIADMIADLEETVSNPEQAALQLSNRRKRSNFPLQNLDALEGLLRMQERETRAILTLSTKMRLAQQSTIEPNQKKNRGVGKGKPWLGS
jgi:hypothetical protein